MRAQIQRGSWRHALGVQADVVGALLMREIHTRYGRDNLGYIWMFLEPALLTAAVIGIHTAGHSYDAGGVEPVPFVIIGYTTFILFRTIFTRADRVLEANAPLLYHRQVSLFDMVFARALLELGSILFVLAVLLAVAIVAGFAEPPVRPLAMLAGIALLWLWSLGLAMLIAAATVENRIVEKFVHPIGYILLPLSGAFYMVDWIPGAYREAVAWFPMTQMFELIRYGHFRDAPDTYVQPVYLMFAVGAVILAGLAALRAVRPKIQLA